MITDFDFTNDSFKEHTELLEQYNECVSLITEGLFGRTTRNQYNPNGKSITRIYVECVSPGVLRHYMELNNLESVKYTDKIANKNAEGFYNGYIETNPSLRLKYRIEEMTDPDDGEVYMVGVLAGSIIARIDIIVKSKENKNENWFIPIYEMNNSSPKVYSCNFINK